MRSVLLIPILLIACHKNEPDIHEFDIYYLKHQFSKYVAQPETGTRPARTQAQAYGEPDTGLFIVNGDEPAENEDRLLA